MTTETLIYPPAFSDGSTPSDDADFVQSPTEPRVEVDNDLPEDAETDDPEAPYGRKPDGTPYKRSSETRARLAANLSRGRARRGATAVKAPGKIAGRKPTAANVKYRDGVEMLLAIPKTVLSMLGQRSRACALDAMTLDVHGPKLADAVQDAADNDERIAQALDKILAVGPYGELIGAVLALGTQMAYNHGRLPIPAEHAAKLGVMDAHTLVETVEALHEQAA